MIKHKIALVNIYPAKTGVGAVAKLYYDIISHMSDTLTITFYQILEKNGIDPPIKDCITWYNTYRIPHFLKVLFSRIFSTPLHLKNIPENLLLLCDPTISFHISGKKKRVVIVHDLRPFTRFETNSGEKLFYYLIKNSFISCDFFICDSYFTKSHLLKLGAQEDKTAVIYPFVNRQDAIVGRTLQDGTITISYIANNLPYKNVETFLKIAKLVSANERKQENFKFILVSNGLDDKLNDLNLGNCQISILSNVDDIDQIYSNTDIYLTTSLYEGIGLPVLEAMSKGIPIIASRIQVNEELIEGYGILCDPDYLEDWANSIFELTDQITYQKYSNKSLERARKFTEDYFIKNFQMALEKLTQK